MILDVTSFFGIEQYLGRTGLHGCQLRQAGDLMQGSQPASTTLVLVYNSPVSMFLVFSTKSH